MKKVYPRGPYFLAGYCAWGDLAIDMAHELIAAGEEVPALILIESYSPKAYLPRTSLKFIRPKTKALYNTWRNLRSFSDKRKFIRKELSYAVKYVNKKVNLAFWNKAGNQPAKKYPGKVILIKASETFGVKDDPYMGWSDHFSRKVKTFTVQGEHLGIMLGSSSAIQIAEILNSVLGEMNSSRKINHFS
jgi:thioesterase domain-containing protein